MATHAPTLSTSSAALGKLLISGTTSVTIATGGTLNLESTGTIAVSSSGGFILSGGSIVAGTAGISLTSSGGISGYGIVNSTISASTASTATITASGSTLDIQKAISNSGALRLAVSSGLSDKLLLDAASVATSLTFSGSTGTLELNTSGTLTLTNALAIGANTVKLDGAATTQLTDTTGISLSTGGHITGAGVVNGGISGTGTITASGGTLALTSAISASSGLTFDIADSAASILKLDGTVGDTNTFAFVGTHGAVELNDVTITPTGLHFSGTVSGLTEASSATPDLSAINYINAQATITVTVAKVRAVRAIGNVG